LGWEKTGWFIVKHVETEASQLPRKQCLMCRVEVNQRPPTAVDEHSARSKPAQRFGIDHVPVLGRQGRVQGHKVGSGENIIQRFDANGIGDFREWVERNHCRTHGRQHGSESLADSAPAHDSAHGTVNVTGNNSGPRVPFPTRHSVVHERYVLNQMQS
jgi:hypothetical protein